MLLLNILAQTQPPVIPPIDPESWLAVCLQGPVGFMVVGVILWLGFVELMRSHPWTRD